MAADTSQKEVHWQRTRSLMIVHLVIWFVFSYLVNWFAPALNKISVITSYSIHYTKLYDGKPSRSSCYRRKGGRSK